MRKYLLISVLWCCTAMMASVVNYTPDNTTIFKNPERGYTEELSRIVSTSKPNVVKGNLDSSWGGSLQMTLAMVLYNFNNFKDKDLPSEVLAGFDEDMQVLRSSGVKCVLRFAYTEKESDKKDATPEWVQRHLQQLQPHLEANADVIYVLEAGFVGVWGEWYYTSNYGNESQHMNAKRRQVIQYLFENAPTNRFILFRYPMLKTEYFGHSTPLPSDSAFTGSMRARWGCHNDAFLNNWGNDGTYASNSKDDDPAVRQYIADETLYVPNGGETNVESNSLAEQVYTKAPEEMSKYHWSFCGKSYATQVTNRWKSSGIYDTLNIHMGYRYQLVRATLPDQGKRYQQVHCQLQIKNTGYAPIYNERPVYIVLKSGSKTYPMRMQSDPRRWLPNNVVTQVDEYLHIPADVPDGTYDLYLYMPDASPSIANDPRFAVRFANTDVWDATTGMNRLNATIRIEGSAEGLDEVSVCRGQWTKQLHNGHFFLISPDGQRYTIHGQQQ